MLEQPELFESPQVRLARPTGVHIAAAWPTPQATPQAVAALPRAGGELRVITLTEPWATLMLFRAKRLETRGGNFPRNYRGPCAIQASKTWPKAERALCGREPFYSVLRARLALRLGISRDDERFNEDRAVEKMLVPTLGHVIALGEIAATFWTDGLIEGNRAAKLKFPPRTAGVCLNPQPVEESFGNYGPGRLALEFRRVRPLSPPVPVSGNLGLWKADPDLARIIRRNAEDFDDVMNRVTDRAGGGVKCALCQRDYYDHPDETEILSDQDKPFLVRACDGRLLKL